MKIDIYKIRELYGKEVIEILNDEYNFEQFKKNILYLYSKKINNIEEIIESYYPIFIIENKEFKEKVDKLINTLGDNYIHLLEEDTGVWSELL